MKLVSVFNCNDLPDKEMRELICGEQRNDSYKRVSLDDGEWEWDDKKSERTYPLDTLAKIAQWAKDNGAYVEQGYSYAYVLFSISW
jgi:hypothetical protein